MRNVLEWIHKHCTCTGQAITYLCITGLWFVDVECVQLNGYLQMNNVLHIPFIIKSCSYVSYGHPFDNGLNITRISIKWQKLLQSEHKNKQLPQYNVKAKQMAVFESSSFLQRLSSVFFRQQNQTPCTVAKIPQEKKDPAAPQLRTNAVINSLSSAPSRSLDVDLHPVTFQTICNDVKDIHVGY